MGLSIYASKMRQKCNKPFLCAATRRTDLWTWTESLHILSCNDRRQRFAFRLDCKGKVKDEKPAFNTFSKYLLTTRLYTTKIDKAIISTLFAILEVFRRFVWNFFRLENEHLNNCGEFRAVRDISIAPLK